MEPTRKPSQTVSFWLLLVVLLLLVLLICGGSYLAWCSTSGTC